MAKLPCLYFPNEHFIKPEYWEIHRKYCRQHNWKADEYEKCPFNALHFIPKPEFEYHLKQCPDRILVESFKNLLFDADKQKQTTVESPNSFVETTTNSFGNDRGGGSRRRNQIPTISSVNDLFVNGASTASTR